MTVTFHDYVDNSLLKFAVIVSKYNEKWVFCKHKDRNTYEVPGGHREAGENILDTAKRELYEETGAADFTITPVCVYSVSSKSGIDGDATYGMLYFADIKAFDDLPPLEIEKVVLSNEMPGEWTYPLIQPILMKKVESTLSLK